MAKTRTSADVSPATRTRMQELGSAWVFKRAIQDNVSVSYTHLTLPTSFEV